MLKLFLQRIRFNLRNLFAKKIVVPTNFKSFEYTNPKYHHLLASYLLSNTDDDINYSKKIFGNVIAILSLIKLSKFLCLDLNNLTKFDLKFNGFNERSIFFVLKEMLVKKFFNLR